MENRCHYTLKFISTSIVSDDCNVADLRFLSESRDSWRSACPQQFPAEPVHSGRGSEPGTAAESRACSSPPRPCRHLHALRVELALHLLHHDEERRGLHPLQLLPRGVHRPRVSAERRHGHVQSTGEWIILKEQKRLKCKLLKVSENLVRRLLRDAFHKERPTENFTILTSFEKLWKCCYYRNTNVRVWSVSVCFCVSLCGLLWPGPLFLICRITLSGALWWMSSSCCGPPADPR